MRALRPDFLACYEHVLAGSSPSLHGKLSLRVVIDEDGEVQSISALPGGAANDPELVSCLAHAIKGAKFSKPGGTASVTVPLLFRR